MIGVVGYESMSGVCGFPIVRVFPRRVMISWSILPVAMAMVLMDVTVLMAVLVKEFCCSVHRISSNIGLWF